MEPRCARIILQYNGVNATDQISRFVDSLQYKDVASGTSDSCSLRVNDKERKWIGAWFPVKGDRLQPTIQTRNWNRSGDKTDFPCGTFCVDDFSFTGGPISMALEAVAVAADSGFQSTKRTITYEATTLQEIGEEIAGRAGITLFYEADKITIEKVEQNDAPDSEFYRTQVERFGLALKIYNDKMVVFSEALYEAKEAKAKLTEADFEPDWSWNTKLNGTYTAIKYQYTNSEKNLNYTVEAGEGDRILTCNEPAENLTEATMIALAAVNKANKGATTMQITLTKAIPGLIASDCVEIAGLGNLSGKYFIEEIDHQVTSGDGYTMALSLRRVEARITEATTISSTVAEEAGS